MLVPTQTDDASSRPQLATERRCTGGVNPLSDTQRLHAQSGSDEFRAVFAPHVRLQKPPWRGLLYAEFPGSHTSGVLCCLSAKQMFAGEGIPYFAVATYKDLGIEPVGGGLVTA
jgi:hypothetical protein